MSRVPRRYYERAPCCRRRRNARAVVGLEERQELEREDVRHGQEDGRARRWDVGEEVAICIQADLDGVHMRQRVEVDLERRGDARDVDAGCWR